MKKIPSTTKKPLGHSLSKVTTNLNVVGANCFKPKVVPVPAAIAIKDTISNNPTTVINTPVIPSRFRHLGINIDQYQLIWLDKDVNATKDNLNTQTKLKEIISNLRVFDDVEEFDKHIKDINGNEKIILILSGNYGRQIVPHLQNSTEVISIYIYCTNESANREWSKSYNKVKHVVTNPNQLIEQLKQDQSIRVRIDANTLPMNIYSRETSDNFNVQEQRDKRNALFMYFLVFIDILLKMPTNNEKAKHELSEVWNEECHGNKQEEKIVQEFNEHYLSSKAIWWYTRESFLYRILNKGLREANLDILFGLRFYLTDLYQQLNEEHINYLLSYTSTSKESILHVYRGQAIAIDELNLIRTSQGEFISFNNFLSTSTNAILAKSFAKQATIIDGLTRVLFEFQIDTNLIGTKPYADISKVSYYQGEEEVLIMLGSIFRIEQVEYDDDGQLWLAKLSLCSENDFELKDLIGQLKKDTTAGMTSLGWLFYRQGELEKAKQFFQRLLREETLSNLDKSNCYGGLGFVMLAMDEHDEALSNYQKALELCIELGNEIDIGNTYYAIGNAYYVKNELDLALFNAQRALDILLPLNHPQLLDDYKVMANISTNRNQLHLAIDYCEKALEVAHHYLPVNDGKIGHTYASMGFIYDKGGIYQQALGCYERAYHIWSKSLSPNHPHISLVKEYIQNTKAKMNEH